MELSSLSLASFTTLLILWFAVLIGSAILEALTVGLTAIWFAAGALAALIVVALGGGFWVSFWVFIAISFLCLFLVRPIARRHLNNRTQATNADRLIGQEAVVTETIDQLAGTGYVSVNNQLWMARPLEPGTVFPAGSRVRIRKIEGVKLLVTPLEAEEGGQS